MSERVDVHVYIHTGRDQIVVPPFPTEPLPRPDPKPEPKINSDGFAETNLFPDYPFEGERNFIVLAEQRDPLRRFGETVEQLAELALEARPGNIDQQAALVKAVERPFRESIDELSAVGVSRRAVIGTIRQQFMEQERGPSVPIKKEAAKLLTGAFFEIAANPRPQARKAA